MYTQSCIECRGSKFKLNCSTMKCAVLILLASLISSSIGSGKLFPLSIIHINDFHAKYEETNLQANTCKGENCIGGYARAVTMIRRLRNSQPNPLYLNAGDNFQGTLWYTLLRWNITQHLLNLETADVMVSENDAHDRLLNAQLFLSYLAIDDWKSRIRSRH
jgi:5'-nucleotidase